MKRCKAHWLFAAGLCLGLMSSVKAQAQTFEEGYQSYMRNQFPVAELQFRAAAKKAKTKEDRGFILKFIGICQFMRGDKKSSASSFVDALNSDRNVTIDEEEVLDPGVVAFFNVIKTRWQNSPEGIAANNAAKPTMPAPKPNPPVALAQTPKAAPQEAPAIPRPTAAETKAAPAPAVDKAKKKKTKDKHEDGGRIISWMHFMPFGLGQFHNDSYILGSAFAFGQVLTLYQYNSLSQQIATERSQNQQVADNPNILQAEKDQFLIDNADYIAGLTSDKNSAATAFAALYIAGVAQSLIFAPRHPSSDDGSGPETSKKLPRKSINTGWIPGQSGGTYLVQLKLNLE